MRSARSTSILRSWMRRSGPCNGFGSCTVIRTVQILSNPIPLEMIFCYSRKRVSRGRDSRVFLLYARGHPLFRLRRRVLRVQDFRLATGGWNGQFVRAQERRNQRLCSRFPVCRISVRRRFFVKAPSSDDTDENASILHTG